MASIRTTFHVGGSPHINQSQYILVSASAPNFMAPRIAHRASAGPTLLCGTEYVPVVRCVVSCKMCSRRMKFMRTLNHEHFIERNLARKFYRRYSETPFLGKFYRSPVKPFCKSYTPLLNYMYFHPLNLGPSNIW